MFAKGLAAGRGLPLWGVNHLAGHALTPRLVADVAFPYLLLLVSGGHCQFLAVEGPDALPPPRRHHRRRPRRGLRQGGEAPRPRRSPAAPPSRPRPRAGDPAPLRLPPPAPRPRRLRPLLLRPEDRGPPRPRPARRGAGRPHPPPTAPTSAPASRPPSPTPSPRRPAAPSPPSPTAIPARPVLAVAGGVAANRAIRAALAAVAAAAGARFLAPPLALCTDNGAMIAWAAAERMAVGAARRPRPLRPPALAARRRAPRRCSAPAARGPRHDRASLGAGAFGTALAVAEAAEGRAGPPLGPRRRRAWPPPSAAARPRASPASPLPPRPRLHRRPRRPRRRRGHPPRRSPPRQTEAFLAAARRRPAAPRPSSSAPRASTPAPSACQTEIAAAAAPGHAARRPDRPRLRRRDRPRPADRADPRLRRPRRSAARCRQGLATRRLRLYLTDDVTGAELGGALKNVIAIACGMVEGARLGASARAALMTRGFAEMTRLAVAMGARPETLAGLSGLGDLSLTCNSGPVAQLRARPRPRRRRGPPRRHRRGGCDRARRLPAWRAHGVELPIAAAVADVLEGAADARRRDGGAARPAAARGMRGRPAMNHWLFKSEAETWSWDDQVAKGAAGQEWDGVRNFQARNNMKAMKQGDLGFFYHSGDIKAVVGVVEVIAEAHPDSTADDAALAMRRHPRRRPLPEAGHASRRSRPTRGSRDGAGEELPPLGPAGQRRGMADDLRDGRLTAWIDRLQAVRLSVDKLRRACLPRSATRRRQARTIQAFGQRLPPASLRRRTGRAHAACLGPGRHPALRSRSPDPAAPSSPPSRRRAPRVAGGWTGPVASDATSTRSPAISNWGRWGPDDQLGTLNFITPELRLAAIRSVRTGRTVSLARERPVADATGIRKLTLPQPALHRPPARRGRHDRRDRHDLPRLRRHPPRRALPPLHPRRPRRHVQRLPGLARHRRRRGQARRRGDGRATASSAAASSSTSPRSRAARSPSAASSPAPTSRPPRPARASPSAKATSSSSATAAARRTATSSAPASTPSACPGSTPAASPSSATTATATSTRSSPASPAGASRCT